MKHILIIDDDTELCELLQEYLASEKFATSTAHGGATGLEMARNGSFDLVILDIMLPEMNGLEVLKSIRSFSKIPVRYRPFQARACRVFGISSGNRCPA